MLKKIYSPNFWVVNKGDDSDFEWSELVVMNNKSKM